MPKTSAYMKVCNSVSVFPCKIKMFRKSSEGVLKKSLLYPRGLFFSILKAFDFKSAKQDSVMHALKNTSKVGWRGLGRKPSTPSPSCCPSYWWAAMPPFWPTGFPLNKLMRAVNLPFLAVPHIFLYLPALTVPYIHIVGLSLIEEFSALIRARITFLSSN